MGSGVESEGLRVQKGRFETLQQEGSLSHESNGGCVLRFGVWGKRAKRGKRRLGGRCKVSEVGELCYLELAAHVGVLFWVVDTDP